MFRKIVIFFCPNKQKREFSVKKPFVKGFVGNQSTLSVISTPSTA
jgi:hypothetical protein